MAKEVRQIKIESILGGHAPTTHFARPDQFRASLGIDPAQPINDSLSDVNGRVASGLLRPVAAGALSTVSTTLADAPLWIRSNPKTATYYVYDIDGSVYSIENTVNSITPVGDLNDGGTARGNGCEYYDNYMYFARSTTVARYGPLNGTAAFTDDYWAATLSKTALVDTSYPVVVTNKPLPNHVLHRHSDGRLYIADVVGNQGTIHYIQTTKTTVEGDTDNGSTYNALDLGYGLWPTAMETYGNNLVIALSERATNPGTYKSAKIAFWDTTSSSPNQIVWVEFPDNLITALKNINGVLYVGSGNPSGVGFRISRYVGGYTFEEVAYVETGTPPYQGAVDGDSTRLLFGSSTEVPVDAPAVYSYNLQKSGVGNGIFNVFRATGDSNATVTALIIDKFRGGDGNTARTPIVGWHTTTSGGSSGIDTADPTGYTDGSYNHVNQMWWSQLYRIGQPFKITKIRIPLAQPLATGMSIIPKIYIDSGAGSDTLTTIDSTNYGTSRQTVVIRPENLTGDNDFWLQLMWAGSVLCTVALPITIEYELLDVDSAYV